MILSVKQRQLGSYDFKGFYQNFCVLQNTLPLQSILCHIDEGILDINADRLKIFNWDPLLNSIKINKNLRFIAVRSFVDKRKCTDDIYSSYGRKPPVLLTSPKLLLHLCKSLRACLLVTTELVYLELQNVPLNKQDVQILCEGITKNSTLKHLSFEGSCIGDEGIKAICGALRSSANVNTLNLTSCDLTQAGITVLSTLIKAMQRHNLAWQESLRYRFPELDRLGGLKRITLNDNVGIGDAGSIILADSLVDDLWVKAIDMQGCNLSDVAAQSWLTVLKGSANTATNDSKLIQGNFSLVVLDLRRNAAISREMLKLVTERALINSEGKQTEFSWLKAGQTPPSYLCSGVVTYPWPGMAGLPSSFRSENTCRYHQSNTDTLSKHLHSELGGNLEKQPIHVESNWKGRQRSGEVRTPRPPFIPAGCHTRSRSTGPVKNRHHTADKDQLVYRIYRQPRLMKVHSGSERSIWKPPGVGKLNDQPIKRSVSARSHSSAMRIHPTSGIAFGIPWRTAARASRCSRGYPVDHHPGQTCLESKSLKLNSAVLDNCSMSRQDAAQRVRRSPISGSISHDSNWSVGRTKTPGHRAVSVKEMRLKIKQMMNHVVSLQSELDAVRSLSNQSKPKQSNHSIVSANNTSLFNGDVGTVAELRNFVNRLTQLTEDINRAKSDNEHGNSNIEILQKTLKDLCLFIGRLAQTMGNPEDDDLRTVRAHGDERSRLPTCSGSNNELQCNNNNTRSGCCQDNHQNLSKVIWTTCHNTQNELAENHTLNGNTNLDFNKMKEPWPEKLSNLDGEIERSCSTPLCDEDSDDADWPNNSPIDTANYVTLKRTKPNENDGQMDNTKQNLLTSCLRDMNQAKSKDENIFTNHLNSCLSTSSLNIWMNSQTTNGIVPTKSDLDEQVGRKTSDNLSIIMDNFRDHLWDSESEIRE